MRRTRQHASGVGRSLDRGGDRRREREREVRRRSDHDADERDVRIAVQGPGELERQTFEQFTENTQTQIDTSTPEEMRWLVMFPKVNMNGFRVLRQHFGAVAGQEASGLAWIEGPLAQQLERAMGSLLRGDPPFLLMTLRGRTYLRVQLIDPDVKSLAAASRESRMWRAAAAATSLAGACVQAKRPSSIFAIALRCTSSGPSAKRKVRAAV